MQNINIFHISSLYSDVAHHTFIQAYRNVAFNMTFETCLKSTPIRSSHHRVMLGKNKNLFNLPNNKSKIFLTKQQKKSCFSE